MQNVPLSRLSLALVVALSLLGIAPAERGPHDAAGGRRQTMRRLK